MLTRIRLPAKIPFHMCKSYLVSCFFLLSRKLLSNISCFKAALWNWPRLLPCVSTTKLLTSVLYVFFLLLSCLGFFQVASKWSGRCKSFWVSVWYWGGHHTRADWGCSKSCRFKPMLDPKLILFFSEIALFFLCLASSDRQGIYWQLWSLCPTAGQTTAEYQ